MSNINLLPWREELRKTLNNIFLMQLGKTVLLTVFIVVVFDQYIAYQIRKNTIDSNYVSNELQKMSPKVLEIQRLEDNRKQLMNHIQAIQDLQQDRFSIVKLLDLMPRILPDGIYLTELTRMNTIDAAKKNNLHPSQSTVIAKTPAGTSNRIQYHILVQGVSLGNTNVAVFLKSLEGISWLSDVKLTEVSMNTNGLGLSFKVEFFQHVASME
jgi:Tfp pilus assembly protein PilN